MTKRTYSEDNKEELISALHAGVVTVSFTKVNGDRRDMECTLNEVHLPTPIQRENAVQARKENPNIQSVYDINAKGWRSWRWDNVIEFRDDADE